MLYFSKDKKKISQKLNKLINTENKKKVNSLSCWQKFSIKSKQHSNDFKNKIINLSKKYKLIGYGASARSSTLLNFGGINNKIMHTIIDKNNLKKNKFTPGSNIKIIDYDEIISRISKFQLIVVLAWNFKKEIIKDLRDKGFKGKFLLPLPNKIKIL